MKRLTILAAALAVCVLSKAQSDSYTMQVYLSGGDVKSYQVSEVDSVVFVSTDVDSDDTTSSDTTYINGYAAVDLGLSVKWATCNVGADSPEDYGNYYAWGETETKDSYTSSNSVTYEVDMDDIAGDAEYDAATANWGSSWRMPTYDEMEELIDSCTWTWTRQNDVNGYLVTGPNANSIFLPAAGNRSGTSLYYREENGYYWSSTPYESNASWAAYYLLLYSSRHSMGCTHRYLGRTVRPVAEF